MNPSLAERRTVDGRQDAKSRLPKVHLKRTVLLVIISFVLSLGLVEILSRLFLPSPVSQFIPSENFRLIYELNPRYPQINSMGMRDEEVDRSSLADNFVIAAIGDSHTYSLFSEKRETTFPARLQHHLHAITGERIRVLNFGVPGYNMTQELEVLRTKVLPIRPNLIVLQYTINDEHISNYIQPRYSRLNKAINQSVFLTQFWTKFLYSRFGQRHFAYYVETYAPDLLLFAPGLIGTPKPREKDPAHAPHPPRSPEQVPKRYHEFIGRDNLEKAVRTFGQAAKAEQIPLMATGFIETGDEALYEEAGFQVRSFYRIFEGVKMQDHGYNPARTSGHFKESGSDLIAEALARFISTNFRISK